MDKDFTEMAVIEREFPNARVLLCQWHVGKYLDQELSKSKYGLSDWQRDMMKVSLRELIDARSEAVYESRIQFIRGILRDNDKIQRWFEYFDANWTSIKEKWCSLYRCDLPHLGNNTNNRLESSWGKLKDLVNKFKEVDECLVSILFWQRTKELAWRRRITRVGRDSVAGADAQIKAIAPIASRYTLKLIRDQYEFAIAPTTEYHTYSLVAITCIQYKPPPPPKKKRVQEDHTEAWSEPTSLDVPDEFSVSLKDSSCLCSFMMTRLLPCRHLMYLLKSKFPNNIIPLEAIHPRWRLDVIADAESERDEVNDTPDHSLVPFEERRAIHDVPVKTLSNTQRYNRLLVVARNIADVASRYGTSHVLDVERSLGDFLELLKLGDVPYVQVSPPVSQEADDGESLSVSGSLPENESLPENHSPGVEDEGENEFESAAVADDQFAEGACDLDDPMSPPHFTDSQYENLMTGFDGAELSFKYSQCGLRREDTEMNDNDVISMEDSDGDFELEVKPTKPVDKPAGEPDKPISEEPDWVFSPTLNPPGRPRITKKKAQQARRELHEEADRQFAVFKKTGQLANLATMQALVEQRRLCLSQGSEFLAALAVNRPKTSRFSATLYTKRPPTPLHKVTSILPSESIRRAEDGMRAFIRRQKRESDEHLSMTDVVVSIEGQVLDVTSLRLMQKALVAQEMKTTAERALKWIDGDPCGSTFPPGWMIAGADYNDTKTRIQSLDLASKEASLLFFAGKENVDSDSITTLMKIIHNASDRRVLLLPTHATTIPFLHQDLLRTAPAIESLQALGSLPVKQSLAVNESLPVIMAAIHFDDPEHWCGLVFDMATNTFTSFDPQQSVDRYSTIEWWVGKHLIPCLPRLHQAVPQSKRFTSVQQQDSYNCGVLVLLFFEMALKGLTTAYFAPHKLARTLQYARYRYLCMGLEEVSASASDTDESDYEN